MATAAPAKVNRVSGSFLITEQSVEAVFIPEDLNNDCLQIARISDEFVRREVLPKVQSIEKKDFSVTRELIQKASARGIANTSIPAEYGGSGRDTITSCVVAENLSGCSSFTVSLEAHATLGTLPIVNFGTAKQKQKYLPKLASGEWIAAFALSESTSGSDALNIATHGALSPEGHDWILNGEKLWVTNGNFADVFIVFAKVDGDKFTAFILDKTCPGLEIGINDDKIGLRGVSTCKILLRQCRIPKSNLLGEIGKGHLVAFNALNIGRLRSAASNVGSARQSLYSAVNYARGRSALGHRLADFGCIKEKIANMAAGIYVVESMLYRTMDAVNQDLLVAREQPLERVEKNTNTTVEFAAECAFVKAWAAEVLGFVVDEDLQIHGGCGFNEFHPAGRAYLDARINRVCHGTDEINKLFAATWVLKRAGKGQLPLGIPSRRILNEAMSEVPSAECIEGPLAIEHLLVRNVKKAILLLLGAAWEKYWISLSNHQELVMTFGEMLMEAYAIESAVVRAHKLLAQSNEAKARFAVAASRIRLSQSIAKIEIAARKIAVVVAEDRLLGHYLATLRRLLDYKPFDTIALCRDVAERIVELVPAHSV